MAPKGTRKPSALSEEYVVDSSDDQEAIQPDQIESANPKLVFKISSKQKSTPKVNGNQKAKTASASSQSTSRSQSEEEEYSGGEEDEDELETADLLDNSAKQASSKSSSSKERPKKKPKTAPGTEYSIPAKPYDPPSGFIRRHSGETDSTSLAPGFLSDSLTGKQVWHITAPASLSLESIRTFGIHAARKGETVLKSDGKSYRFTEEASANKCLLTPTGNEDEYVQGKAVISRTYHLREIIDPPAKGKDTEANHSGPMYFEFQPDEELPVRRMREQPKGLHMRYKPFGTRGTSPADPNAERSEIFIPDEIPARPEERHGKRKKEKSQRNRKSPIVEKVDTMEEPSQDLLNSQIKSPESNKHPSSSSKKVLGMEKSTTGQEGNRRKSKKHTDRVSSSK